MAVDTCRSFLTIPDLKQICEHRGWSPMGSSKDDLIAFVAPRIAGPEGVERARATLDERGLVLLHRFALFPLSIHVRDLTSERQKATKSWGLEDRTVFKDLADHLLNRGLALVHDTRHAHSGSESRFARLTFAVPQAHLGLLPPFPIETKPLGPEASQLEVEAFCKEALSVAIRQASAKKPHWPQGLLGRLASSFSLEKDTLSLPGKPRVSRVTDLVDRLVDLWVAKSEITSKPAVQVAIHVLSHLPKGQGCPSHRLAEAVGEFAQELSSSEAASLCDDGFRAGMLIRGGQGDPVYTKLSSATSESNGVNRRLSIEPVKGSKSVEVDLASSDLGAVLELAAYSLVTVSKGRLRLTPSVVHLGRARGRLAEIDAVNQARKVGRAYQRAVEHVEARHGKTLLHQGLTVIRIDDLGLRTLLTHRLGDKVRNLGGSYLAITAGALDEAVKIVEKEGFSPRRVSA
jgi:hypothetical protein